MKKLELPGIKEHELKEDFSEKCVYTEKELEAMENLKEKYRKTCLIKPPKKKRYGKICRQGNTELAANEEIERAM